MLSGTKLYFYVKNKLKYAYSAVFGYSHVKGKVYSRTGHEGPDGECRYSSTFSLTSALERRGRSVPHPGLFTPCKEALYPLYRRAGLSG